MITIAVDFNFGPDGLVLARTSEADKPVAVGDIVWTTDGDDIFRARVESIDENGTIALHILWDEPNLTPPFGIPITRTGNDVVQDLLEQNATGLGDQPAE